MFPLYLNARLRRTGSAAGAGDAQGPPPPPPPAAASPRSVPKPLGDALRAKQGDPLPDADGWSARIGADVSGARLVTGDEAARAAASIQARAFTVGSRIFFGAAHGPHTDGGALLRHELVHVAQQGNAEVPSSPSVLRFTAPHGHEEVQARSGLGLGLGRLRPSGEAVVAREPEPEPEPDIDAQAYLDQFTDAIGDGVRDFIKGQAFPIPLPFLRWTSDSAFVAQVLSSLGAEGGGALTARLPELLTPAGVMSWVNRGRRKATVRVTDDKTTWAEESQSMGPARWFPDVAVELGQALAAILSASLARVAPRYLDARVAVGVARDQAEKKTVTAAPPDPSPSDIIPGHAVDPLTISALTSGVVSFDWVGYRSANPDAKGRRGQLRPVGFCFELPEPGVYWVRVTAPADPTVEEVANALFGSPTLAPEISVVAPPLFGWSGGTRLLPALKRALEAMGVDLGLQGDPVGAALRGPLADEVALAQANAKLTSVADKSDVLQTMGHSLLLFDVIQGIGQAFGVGRNPTLGDLGEGKKRLEDKRAQLEGADEATAARWGAHATAQRQILTQVSFGLSGLEDTLKGLTKTVEDAGIKLGAFNLPQHVRLAMNRIAGQYIDAARLSHFPGVSEARLAAAEEGSRLLPIEILEGTLASIQRTADEALKNKREEGGDHASYGVPDIQKREEALRLRLAGLRTALLAGGPDAAKALQKIQEDILDLQTEAELVGSMDQLDAAWQGLENALSIWLSSEITLGNVRRLQKVGNGLHQRWKAIHTLWKKGDPASREQAKKDLAELRKDPALGAYFGEVREEIHQAQVEVFVGQIVALMVITVVTAGVGELVAGFVGAWELSAGATAFLVGGAEAVSFTALSQIFLDNDHAATHIAGELAFNWLMFGALRRFSAFAKATQLSKAAAMGGQLVLLGAMTFAREEAIKYAKQGKHLTREEMGKLAIQGLVMFVALNAAGRYAEPIMKSLEAEGSMLGTRIRAANRAGEGIRAMNEALQGSRDPAKALAYIKAERAWLEAKARAYSEVERVATEEAKADTPPKDGGVLKKTGLTLEGVQKMKADLGEHIGKLNAAEEMLGLEAIAPDLYTCPKELLEGVLTKLSGGKLVAEDPVTKARTFEVKGPDGRTIRIVEKIDQYTRWVLEVKASLTPEELPKLEEMLRGQSPKDLHDSFAGDKEAARARVQKKLADARAALGEEAASKERADALRLLIDEQGLMQDPEIRAVVEKLTETNHDAIIEKVRDKLMARILAGEAQAAFPTSEVLVGVKVYVKQAQATVADWSAANPGKKTNGLAPREDGLYMQVGEVDMMVVSRDGTILLREEVKTGKIDKNSVAQEQIERISKHFAEGSQGESQVRLELGGKDITSSINLSTDASATKQTRGPLGKGFNKDLGLKAPDLEKLVRDLVPSIEPQGSKPKGGKKK